MSKKQLYDTPEMEIKELRKQLLDLKNEHAKKSDALRINACGMSLDTIKNAKNIIESLRKQKRAIANKIDKLQPALDI